MVLRLSPGRAGQQLADKPWWAGSFLPSCWKTEPGGQHTMGEDGQANLLKGKPHLGVHNVSIKRKKEKSAQAPGGEFPSSSSIHLAFLTDKTSPDWKEMSTKLAPVTQSKANCEDGLGVERQQSKTMHNEEFNYLSKNFRNRLFKWKFQAFVDIDFKGPSIQMTSDMLSNSW